MFIFSFSPCIYIYAGFPGGSGDKVSACNAETWVQFGKIPWWRKWLLTPVFLPGKFLGLRSLVEYSPRGSNESDMTKWLHLLSFRHLCVCVCVCVCDWVHTHTHAHVQLFATTWTVAHQDPLSLEFSKQEYLNRLPFPTPGDLLNPEIETVSLFCIGGQILYHWAPWKSLCIVFMNCSVD